MGKCPVSILPIEFIGRKIFVLDEVHTFRFDQMNGVGDGVFREIYTKIMKTACFLKYFDWLFFYKNK